MGRTPQVCRRSPSRLDFLAWACCVSAWAILGVVGSFDSAHAAELHVRLQDAGASKLDAQLQVLEQRQHAHAKATTLPPPRPLVTLSVSIGAGETLRDASARVPVEVLGTSHFHGYSIATIGLRAEDARLLGAHDVIRLRTEPAREAPARSQRPNVAREQKVSAELGRIVINPADLGLHAPAALTHKSGATPTTTTFSPSELPSIEGSRVQMLILTRDVLLNAFQVYADERTRSGVPTVVRTIEWVEQNFPHGADLQETLRMFIREAYELWGIDTILLGGDTDIVPARYAYSTYTPSPEEVPTDLYYACLDGGWNDDGDSHWGEAYQGPSDPGDNADLFAELYVGRLPVHNDEEVQEYRAKFDAYAQPQVTDYQNKMLFLSEVLWPANYSPGGSIFKNGADNSERIILLNDLDAGSAVLTKYYETPSSYPGSTLLTRQAAIDEMNASHGIVTHIGHGFRYTMSMGDRSLTNLQASALTNAQRPFFLVMLNCTAGAFDFPCLAEEFILNPTGGAVGVVGASREAFPDGSQFYLEAWFEKLFDDPGVTASQALHEARLKYVSESFYDTVFRWTNFITSYLGDPTVRVWSETPVAPVVTHDSSVPIGSQQFNVQVQRSGLPVSGATVSVWKQGEFYGVGSTDLSGNATLDIRPEAAGTADLYVSGPGIVPYATTIDVQTQSGVALRVSAVVQIDDSSPGTLGNGNGRIEAGEEVDLVLHVVNEGQTTGTNVAFTVSSTDPFVSLPSPTVVVGTLNAGEGVAAPGLRVVASALPPDQHHVEFEIALTADGANSDDRIAIDLLQVAPQLVGMSVVDPDENGTPDAGETYDLVVQFKNYGFAQLNGASAELSSSDPDVSISVNADVLGDVGHLGVASATFQVTESDVATENPMQVVLTDADGRTWSFDVETRRPDAPTALNADASAGPDIVLLDWVASTASDVAGYHIYRALDAAGPWQRANGDLIGSGTYFGDHGLSGSTTYYYAAVSVDVSGNESVFGNVVNVKTNPVQVAGFPRVMGQWGSSAPVAVDVDGDQQLEIFAGSDRLYAWDPDGSEVIDGDGDPGTDGVFSALGANFTAGLAAGDLDADGMDEIVACSWDTREIYVFDADGSVLPGWPRSLAVNTHGIWASPVVADLDLDQSPEIIVLGLDGRLYAWHANGTEVLDGDSDAGTDGVFFVIPSPNLWSRGAPVVANVITDDPTPEIIFGARNNALYVLRADGSVPAGWPRVVGDEITSAAAIGDIDADGTLEIAVAATDGFLYVLRPDGTDLPGWPVAFESHWAALTPSVALHDFDADGKLELVVGSSETGQTSSGQLFMFDWQGNVEPGWPVNIHSASEASPVIGDVDGDGIPEIIYGGESGEMYGFRPDGTLAPGFPIRLGAEMRATPQICDPDHDGDVDVVFAGWDQVVYVFDFAGAYNPGYIPWPTLKGDTQRTGVHEPINPTDAGETPLPTRTQLLANVPNPFNPATRVAFELGGTKQVHARLRIFDTHGRLVRSLVNERLAPGRHVRIWDGRDDRGRSAASGVYYYRLSTPEITQNRKMVLLR